MAYYLGIDLGTTYTAAAAEREGVVEALSLGNRTASVPSVVFLRDDGEILVGEAATRRATSDPGRVAREFKRRVGDPTPIILGGTPYAAEMLMARLLRWSIDRVQEQQGEPPRAIALTHPANWGPYKLDLFTQAIRQVDLDAALMIAEPVAAATFYASQRRLTPGSVVAVYDLGGGTFDAAMVRRNEVGFEIIGTPEGMERLGGIDFDESVFSHVREAVGDTLDRLDPEEPAAQAAVARLRQECIDAKEALSSDTDVSIPVLLPGLQTEVRLTRSEFEAMIRPAISETIVALRRAIRSASVKSDEISAVLLVGGSSRIPLVAQMVGAELGRPIAIDAHPKDAIAFGAAIAVAERRGAVTPESITAVLADSRPPPPTVSSDLTRRPAPPSVAAAAGAAAGLGAAAVRPPAPPTRPSRPAPPGGPRPTGPTGPGSAGPGGAAPAGARPGAAAPGRPAGPPRDAPGGPGSSRPAPPPGRSPAGTGTGASTASGPGGSVPSSPAPGANPSGSSAGPTGERPLASPGPPGRAPAPGGSPASRAPAPGSGPAGRAPAPGRGPAGRAPALGSGPGSASAPPRPGAPAGGAANPAGIAPGRPAGPPSGGYRPVAMPSGPQSPAPRPAPSPYGGTPRAGGTPYGGHSSGSFPAAPRPAGAADNKVLWIVLGVVAAVAIIAIIVVSMSGGDDGGTNGGGSGGGGGGGADSGYTAAVEEQFITSCVDSGGTESACGCAWTEVTETISFERFTEIEAELADDPSAAPPELTEILATCMEG